MIQPHVTAPCWNFTECHWRCTVRCVWWCRWLPTSKSILTSGQWQRKGRSSLQKLALWVIWARQCIHVIIIVLLCMCMYITVLSMCSCIIDHTLSVIHEFHCVSICSWLPLYYSCMSGEQKEAVCRAGWREEGCRQGWMFPLLDSAHGAGSC